MINRTDRDSLINYINQYISEEISAFDLDDSLMEIADKTDDETVKIVSEYMWYFYDDLKDHNIVATKEEWDLFQRFILLLKSDEKLIEIESKKYTVRQIFSLILLCIFFFAWWKFGWNVQLLMTSMVLGVFSIIISFWKRVEEQKNSELIPEIFPFENFSHLMKIRKNNSRFKKKKYNRKLESQRVRSPIVDILKHLRYRISWLIYSPIVLLFQSLPEKVKQIKIMT